MKTAIILHGMPSKEEYFDPTSPAPSNAHWLPWIQRELLLKGILAQTPEMPEPYQPVYEKWRAVFEQFKVDEETLLIGHSCGAGFLVRWLSENNIKVSKVVLVAPWLDPAHELSTGFFDFEIDPKLVEKTNGVTLFVSSDDDPVILESVEKLKTEAANITLQEFTHHGHFCLSDMKTTSFPELRDILID